MIFIDFQEPDSEEWKKWKLRCKVATEKNIEIYQQGTTPTISNLYKEQKEVFFSTNDKFYGKCAYCETLLTTNQPGDIEHYRPKSRITGPEDQPISIDDGNGGLKPHPGYFWLAYNYLNLLPACSDCNRPNSSNSGGIRVGKWDQFPINGVRATKQGDEEHELPLLINPASTNPNIDVDVDKLGILLAKSDKGSTTIDLLGLNKRQSLVDERKVTYEQAQNSMRLLVLALIMNGNSDQYKAEVEDYKLGKRPYSIAGRKGIEDYKNENKQVVEALQ